MSAKIIDGKAFAEGYREKLKNDVAEFTMSTGKKAGLAVIMVGNNSASEVYVKNKINGCNQVGISSFSYNLPELTSQKELIELVEILNKDKNVNGILVQLPLPKHLDEQTVLNCIEPKKDVDGFLPVNIGKLALSLDCSKACTPFGCVELIKSTGIDIAGKNAVVVGRSNIVGKPMALMLLAENATVTVCHSKTADLAAVTRNADILVVAIGRANFITGNMIKPGAVVIDVGMNRVDGKLCGDVEFSTAKEVAGYITPVPGGVGPMTITMLLQNTLNAAKIQNA